ncbi:helix-turn-helix transcriptional regulator [Lichenicoccus sp.]|uniref:helix-turn-helix transcriptional regulator n=1 Tax=Lichenicoccus sp. TaxID=2781899 RepID=UPI003D10BE54
MSRRPVGFSSPDRFLIYAHKSQATVYPEEAHKELQICIPAPNANYTVHRHSAIGGATAKRLEGRDILVIPPNQPHAIAWHREAAIVSLLIDACFIEGALEGKALDVRDGLTIRDAYLSATAQRIWDVLATGHASLTILEALTTGIIYGISEQANKSRSLSQREMNATPLSFRQMTTMRQYIDEHVAEDLSVEVLAKQLGMSPWHFGRRLRAGTGLSPHSFLTDQRFIYAQKLLKNRSASVLDVALAVGMTHSHFTRVFRRRFGITPTAFRQEEGWRT